LRYSILEVRKRMKELRTRTALRTALRAASRTSVNSSWGNGEKGSVIGTFRSSQGNSKARPTVEGFFKNPVLKNRKGRRAKGIGYSDRRSHVPSYHFREVDLRKKNWRSRPTAAVRRELGIEREGRYQGGCRQGAQKVEKRKDEHLTPWFRVDSASTKGRPVKKKRGEKGIRDR